MDLGQRELEDRLRNACIPLGPQALGERSGIGEIAEEHRDLLVLSVEGRALPGGHIGEDVGSRRTRF
jgi:hypothetical protein